MNNFWVARKVQENVVFSYNIDKQLFTPFCFLLKPLFQKKYKKNFKKISKKFGSHIWALLSLHRFRKEARSSRG